MLAAGIVGPVAFVTTFTLDGWLRPGYDAASMFVSELSLGPGGWVQRTSFLLCGVLIAVFATALPRTLPAGRARRVATTAVVLVGAGLAASCFFATDPSAMFSQVSTHGRIHGLLGAVVFLCMPVGAGAVAACLRGEPDAAAFRRWSRAVAVALVGLILLLKLSELPALPLFAWKGLVQRLDLVVHLTWLTTLAVHVAHRRSSAPRPRAGA